MEPVLEYASVASGHRVRKGFAIILAVNTLALAPSIFILALGISNDAMAHTIAFVIGGAVLFVELLAGSLPAFVYLSRHGSGMGRWAKGWLIVAGSVPQLVNVAGIVCGIVLPATTHPMC